MDATTPIRIVGAAVVACGSLLLAAPAQASYGWPLKPFHVQHPVRAYFGDPRISGHDTGNATIHFGIDISAPDGTPVYATIDGIASIHPLHHDTVIVSGAGGVAHEYWHVIPAIVPGTRVIAGRTIVGHIEKPWKHVHFSERHGGTYVNPLRRGALSPYRDTTRPTIQSATFERNGAPVGTRISGTVDVVAEAWDTVPVAVDAPWNDKPVTPALVEWRVVGPRSSASSTWRVAADFRDALPSTPYSTVYARWTRQNHPWGGRGRGRYRFFLARSLDTRTLPNGTYRLVVRVADTRGNATQVTRTFTIANDV
ncbi:MAG: M23 family metallopeptidase [Gaiellaceae bacterium]